MAGEKDGEEWSPKTRDDWKGLFKDSFGEALGEVISTREEKESKSGNDDGGKEGGSGGDDTGGKPKRRGLGEILLGS